MTTTTPFPLTRRIRTPDGKVRGKVTRYSTPQGFVYVPYLSDSVPALSDPNRVTCKTWTEARETILGIYR